MSHPKLCLCGALTYNLVDGEYRETKKHFVTDHMQPRDSAHYPMMVRGSSWNAGRFPEFSRKRYPRPELLDALEQSKRDHLANSRAKGEPASEGLARYHRRIGDIRAKFGKPRTERGEAAIKKLRLTVRLLGVQAS